MEVHFATKKLCESLSHDKLRVRSYGAVVAKKLALRINALQAATSLEDIRHAAGRCHELAENRAGQLALDLNGNLRLIFAPTAKPPPSVDDGGLDWTAVKVVTILEVTDYHGD
jgi:plasmid maintenance system killer protein